jgi:hypothetical protein
MGAASAGGADWTPVEPAGGGTAWMASAPAAVGCGAAGGVGSFTADMTYALKTKE